MLLSRTRAVLFIALAGLAAANAIGANELYNASCQGDWTDLPDVTDLLRNLTEDAWGTWLESDAADTENISCDLNTTQGYTLYINTACKLGSSYEILFTATFQCFYNETPWYLPIEDPDAVLGDIAILDAQLSLDSADAATDDSAQVVFVKTIQAFETYDNGYSVDYSDYVDTDSL